MSTGGAGRRLWRDIGSRSSSGAPVRDPLLSLPESLAEPPDLFAESPDLSAEPPKSDVEIRESLVEAAEREAELPPPGAEPSPPELESPDLKARLRRRKGEGSPNKGEASPNKGEGSPTKVRPHLTTVRLRPRKVELRQRKAGLREREAVHPNLKAALRETKAGHPQPKAALRNPEGRRREAEAGARRDRAISAKCRAARCEHPPLRRLRELALIERDGPAGDRRCAGPVHKELDMPDLFLRLLPFLVLLGLFAMPHVVASRPQHGLTKATGENGMIIDPNGGTTPGGAPVKLTEPTDPGF